MQTVIVTVISREGCHLCDDASAVIEGIVPGYQNVEVEHRMLEENPEWMSYYSDKIPVILIDGVEHGYWRVNEDIFKRALVAQGALPQHEDSE